MEPSTVEHRNAVTLIGRVSAIPEERELPSGDRILTMRVIVERPLQPRPMRVGVRPPRVDTIDCVAWTGIVQEEVRDWVSGDVVAIEGAIRRRFWRSGSGAPTSRYEIEIATARLITRSQPVAWP